jgi:hypothetical protein
MTAEHPEEYGSVEGLLAEAERAHDGDWVRRLLVEVAAEADDARVAYHARHAASLRQAGQVVNDDDR